MKKHSKRGGNIQHTKQMAYYYTLIDNPYQVLETDMIDELIIALYNNEATFISDEQRIEKKLPDTYFNDLRKAISAYSHRVPMYDIMFNRIYLVYADNIYPRLYHDNYRFINKNFYQDLIDVVDPNQTDLENKRILSYYDLDVLQHTYYRIFYQSFVFNSYITSCRRPSFSPLLEHIKPYYTIDELYYLAYDWNLTDKSTLKEDELNTLCKNISQYDISAQTLLDHQIYIYNSRSIGLVKHYSLFGSYYMNVYLRKYRCCLSEPKKYDMAIRNLDLENQILIMIKLIKGAPEFIKSHTVYRFVEKDDYMRHLKPGDIYQDPSFMSTTRNPFYYQENYAFGYILIKIKIPKQIKGVGLCIESYSNFPREEEIILPPTSRYRLDRITDSEPDKINLDGYQHILNKRVQKKYEFTWMGNDYIDNARSKDESVLIHIPNAMEPEIKIIDFRELIRDENLKYSTISERLKYFRDTYVGNINNQFKTRIIDTVYTFNLESYNSSSVYKTFFYYEDSNGIMITSANPTYGNINILLELGTDMHVNYYFRFSISDTSASLNLNQPEWIEWLSLLAYTVGSRHVVIHSNYIMLPNKNDSLEIKQMKTRYTFSQNIYMYLKNKSKFFNNFIEVTPGFDYGQLDLLYQIPTNQYIKSSDPDELYRIVQKALEDKEASSDLNMAELYIYIVENYPKFLTLYISKMELIYQPERNPFLHIYYTLDPWIYLYNRNLVNQIPSDHDFVVKKGSFKSLIGDKKIPKFKNRLRSYLLGSE